MENVIICAVIKELQNFKDAFLKKLSDFEHNLERNFKEKKYDDKYERLLNLLEKENLFLKGEIRRKDKVIKILLDNFSNRAPEHLNYITSKNIKLKIIYGYPQLVTIIAP